MNELDNLRLSVYTSRNLHDFLGFQPHLGIEPGLVFVMKSREVVSEDHDPQFPLMAFSIVKENVTEQNRMVDHTFDPDLSGATQDLIVAEKAALKTLPSIAIKNDSDLMSNLRRESSSVARATRRGMAKTIIGNSKTLNDVFGSKSYREVSAYNLVKREYVKDGVIYLLYVGANAFDRFAFLQQTLTIENDSVVPIGTYLKTIPESATYGVKIRVT